jgi:hypothetical protein
LCKDCNNRFQSKSWKKKNLKEKIFHKYLFKKQVFRELKDEFKLSKKIIKQYLIDVEPSVKVHNPRPVHIVVDATHFGKRLNESEWCVIVFRDPVLKEDLWWKFCDLERDIYYQEGKEFLEQLGYTLKSVTGDGNPSIRRVFSNSTVFQMCLVHMQRIVKRGTTLNPQLEAGKVLLALSQTLTYTKKKVFLERLENYFLKYKSFVNQKTINPSTGESWYTHEELRKATYSLFNLTPFLFSFKTNTHVHKTTNSIESHFRHIKNILAPHSGLKKVFKQKLLHEIFVNGSIVPKKKP